MTAASAVVLTQVAELDRNEMWRANGATSMTSWLAARYNLLWGVAREWVRVARALRTLPWISRAYARSELSWDQVRPLTKFADESTDSYWADVAPSRSPAALWDEARRRQQVQPRDAAETHRWRYLSFDWNEEKTEISLAGRLGAEQGAALEYAVVSRSEQIVVVDDPIDPVAARQADALVELATGATGECSPPTLVVHADARVLTMETEHSLAETESGARLPSDAVRRLACDARIEWILERDGRPVGIGRRGRSVPGGMLRALRFRDRGCRFPGCGRTRWLKAHHLVHWARGGGTDLGNLVLLCHAHHRLIHEGGWTTSGHPGRDLRFHDPTGRPLRSLGERIREAPDPTGSIVAAAG
jgi:hypothetical protein